MLGSSSPPKQPGDLLIQPCLHREGENRDEVVWTERWGQREDSLLFCYPVTKFPVWLGRLPWSLLCWDTYSDTDSDRSAVIDRGKTWPVSGSVFFLFLLSSTVIYFLTAAHDIFTRCPPSCCFTYSSLWANVCEEYDCHLLYDFKHYSLLTIFPIFYVKSKHLILF